MDQTYRTELRELNELNFARFDAKLERRLAEQTRWLFVAWATQILTLVGLLARR